MSGMIRLSLLALVLTFVTGCAPLTVDFDYDPTYDFSAPKTFAFAPAPAGDQMEEFTEKRFVAALTSQLQAKGLAGAAENPDMLITMEGIKKTVEGGRSAVGASIAVPVGSHGSVSLGGGKSKPRMKTEGEVTILFTDRTTGKPVWKGMASAELKAKQSPEEQQKSINLVVAELLKNYPPKPMK